MKNEIEEIEKRINDNMQNIVYKNIEVGTAEQVEFTGNMELRQAQFDKGGKVENVEFIDFELVEKTPDGHNKILSRNIKNRDVPKILNFIKEGKKKLFLSKSVDKKMSVAVIK